MTFSSPEPLAAHHQLAAFDSGVPSLDDWLKRRVAQNQASGASRTFVTCDGNQVVGYYALASSAVAPAQAPGRFRRNMPDPIPVVVLARLAVDNTQKGKGVGRALLQDAARRAIHAAEAIGIRGMMVHALSQDAKNFYLRLGLTESPLDAMIPMITIADRSNALAA